MSAQSELGEYLADTFTELEGAHAQVAEAERRAKAAVEANDVAGARRQAAIFCDAIRTQIACLNILNSALTNWTAPDEALDHV